MPKVNKRGLMMIYELQNPTDNQVANVTSYILITIDQTKLDLQIPERSYLTIQIFNFKTKYVYQSNFGIF